MSCSSQSACVHTVSDEGLEAPTFQCECQATVCCLRHTIHSSTVLVTAMTVTIQLPHMPLHLAKTSCVFMMSGAACEDGTFCDTGRADATGGYCTPIAQAAGMTPTSAPALAPSGESTSQASTQANQECSATGMSWSQGKLSDRCYLACWLRESKHAQ